VQEAFPGSKPLLKKSDGSTEENHILRERAPDGRESPTTLGVDGSASRRGRGRFQTTSVGRPPWVARILTRVHPRHFAFQGFMSGTNSRASFEMPDHDALHLKMCTSERSPKRAIVVTRTARRRIAGVGDWLATMTWDSQFPAAVARWAACHHNR
jgi:hypothetical protein